MKLSIGLCMVTTALFLQLRVAYSSGRSRLRTAFNSSPHAHQHCLEFVEYLPSSWENKWLSLSQELNSSVCKLMEKDTSSVDAWVHDMAPANPPQYTKQGQIWSFFKYRDACSKSSMDFVFVPIEPAVGLLRHPLAPPCYADRTALEVEDRGYDHLKQSFDWQMLRSAPLVCA